LYLHPYELDPAELREIGHPVPFRTRLTQGLNRRFVRPRLERLLKEFRFGPVRDVILDCSPSSRPGAQHALTATC
jgi:hypothetical protein